SVLPAASTTRASPAATSPTAATRTRRVSAIDRAPATRSRRVGRCGCPYTRGARRRLPSRLPSWSSPRESPNLPPAEAVRRVIVDHPRRLHERVADRRPHELEAARLQVPAERACGVGHGGHPPPRRPRVLPRRAGHVEPDPGADAAVLLLHPEPRARVADRGLDLRAVPHDRRVAEEFSDPAR